MNTLQESKYSNEKKKYISLVNLAENEKLTKENFYMEILLKYNNIHAIIMINYRGKIHSR